MDKHLFFYKKPNHMAYLFKVADFGLSQMYNEWEVSEDDEHLIRTSR